MKLPLLFSVGMLMLGCASTPKPAAKVPTPTPTTAQCINLYFHGLGLAVNQVLDPDKDYPKEVVQEAVINLNAEYMESGKARRSVLYCQTKLNMQQVSCMMQASSLPGMSICESATSN